MEPSCAPSSSSSSPLAHAAADMVNPVAAASAPRRGPKPGAREAGTRWVLEPDDIMLLERVFQLEACPGKELKHQLATHLNVRPRQVQVWFQNKRQRSKLGTKTLATERQPRAEAAAAAAALVVRDTQAAQSAALLLSLVQDRRAPVFASEPAESHSTGSVDSAAGPSTDGPSTGPSTAAGGSQGVRAGAGFGDCHGICCLAAASQSLEVVAAAPSGLKPEPEQPLQLLADQDKGPFGASPRATASQSTPPLQSLVASPGSRSLTPAVREGSQPAPAASLSGLQPPYGLQPQPSGLQSGPDAPAVAKSPRPRQKSQQPPDGFTDGAVLWMRSDMLGRYPAILTHGHAPVYVSPGHSAAMLPETEPAQEPPEPRAGSSGSS